MILDNRRITIKEVADDVGISFGSYQAIFTDVFGMKRSAAKIVSKLLNFEQKQRQEMLNDDPHLLKKIITGVVEVKFLFSKIGNRGRNLREDNKIFLMILYGYDIETKAQSSQWKQPGEQRPKNSQQVW